MSNSEMSRSRFRTEITFVPIDPQPFELLHEIGLRLLGRPSQVSVLDSVTNQSTTRLSAQLQPLRNLCRVASEPLLMSRCKTQP